MDLELKYTHGTKHKKMEITHGHQRTKHVKFIYLFVYIISRYPIQ